jgi:IS30 family transposase
MTFRLTAVLEPLQIKEIDTAIKRLNHRPQKRYGFKSPNEVFLVITGIALQT